MGAAAVLEMMAAAPLREKFSANPNCGFLSPIVILKGEKRQVRPKTQEGSYHNLKNIHITKKTIFTQTPYMVVKGGGQAADLLAKREANIHNTTLNRE